MNSLNILSSRVIGIPTTTRPRSRSQGEILSSVKQEDRLKNRSSSDHDIAQKAKAAQEPRLELVKKEEDEKDVKIVPEHLDDKSPLIEKGDTSDVSMYNSRLRTLVKKIADALTALMGMIGAPVVYVATCFQDENGRYSPIVPLKRIRRYLGRRKANESTTSIVALSAASSGESWDSEKLSVKRRPQDAKLQRSYSSESIAATTSESEVDKRKSKRHSKTRPDVVGDDGGPTRRSIRIKINNEDSAKRRKQRKTELAEGHAAPLTVDNIKSPISASVTHKPTRYPHAPHPPRPLIPRRQPSYSNLIPRSPSSRPTLTQQNQKTLVIDLDETLIHSLAKGGRMSSGHMVEVKLNAPVYAPVASITNQPAPIIGPQHPILYYVHKRPHCDEFLRKVCKWYKLVVFTASVQEYADPVIDWLELERTFFVGRYYRQHCTLRNGAYIKDLSSVEPDLSKVMILDNSPMSYIFHEGEPDPSQSVQRDLTDSTHHRQCCSNRGLDQRSL